MYDRLPSLVYTYVAIYVHSHRVHNKYMTYKHMTLDAMFSCPVSLAIK